MTTTTTTIGAAIFNEVMSDRALRHLAPKSVVVNHINYDSIDGDAALSKEYRKHADLGAATAATQGVDFTTVTDASFATTITATPTEAAVVRMDVTSAALRRGVPGFSAQQVFDALASGDYSAIMSIAEEYAERMGLAIAEKIESDAIALLDDFTDTAGASGSDFSLANFLEAIYDLEGNEPSHEDFALFLDQEQVRNIRTELTAGTGASLATPLAGALDVSVLNQRNDVSRNGFKGGLLGVPVYQLSPSLRLTANAGADVVGALMARGDGTPDGGQRGALVMCEGHPLQWLVDFDASARTVELIAIQEYAMVEHTDEHGVSVITDAP